MSKIVGIEDNHAPKDELFRVEWNLGKRCNYNCSYCGNELMITQVITCLGKYLLILLMK